MKQKILVLSTQYPGYGGASTNAYAIIKYLRERGYNVVGIFIEDNINADVDPDKIGNIYKFPLYTFAYNVKNKIMEYKNFLDNVIGGTPNIILCKNYIAPICSKMLYPNIKNYYFVSGLCNAIEICVEIPANEMISTNVCIPQSQKELTAIKNSDVIVMNSQLTTKIFCKSYPEYVNKVHPKIIDTSKHATILINDNQKFEKIYDFIIAASILTRKEKNNLFLIDMLKNPKFDIYSKLIIGNDNSDFVDIPNSAVLNLMPHAELMMLMKQSKVLLYPSLYDSNPNTIREAIHNKCLVLLSNNIGFYEMFPEISVCKSYDYSEWSDKGLYLVENYDEIIINYSINLNIDDQSLVELIEKTI
jgi:glycosyltransferase involved in cell wall biosynthesis